MTPSQLPSIGTSESASSLAVDRRIFARRSTVAYISGGHPVLPLPLQLAHTVHPIPRHRAHRIGRSSCSIVGHAAFRSAAPVATQAASCAASAGVDTADGTTCLCGRPKGGTGRDVDDAPRPDATRAAIAVDKCNSSSENSSLDITFITVVALAARLPGR